MGFTPTLTSIIKLFPKINIYTTCIPLLYPWKKLFSFFLSLSIWFSVNMLKLNQSSFRERIKFLNGNKFLLLHFRWIEKEENPKLYASLFKCAIVKVVCFFFGHPPHLQLSSFTVCLEQKYVLALCVIFVQLLKFWSCFGKLVFFKSNLKATVSCLIEINSSVLPSCWLESWRIVICLCSFASSALYMAFELSSSIVEAT